MGKDKWAKVIDYLNTLDVNDESVLNLIKQTFGAKGKPKTDHFNLV